MLKPNDLGLDELRWQAQVLADLRPLAVRVAPPRRGADGVLEQDGWTAWERLTGTHQPGRWEEIIRAGQRFHAALAPVSRPSFLEARISPWASADRMAWDEEPLGRYREVVGVASLADLRAPLEAPSQCVHGDLTGNVLFAPGHHPGLVDFSPYWRPAVFASAVVVADALLFEGADRSLAERHRDDAGFPQALIRALLFRLISDAILHEYPANQPVWQARGDAIAVATSLI